MKRAGKVLVWLLVATVAAPAAAQVTDWASHAARPPAGVDGARTLPAGGWLLRYRYRRAWRDGNRDGTRRTSVQRIRDLGFSVVPTAMLSEVHDLRVLYAPFDRLTLSAALPVARLRMDLLDDAGNHFRTAAVGVGDVELAAVVPFIAKGGESLHIRFGLSLPTGSIRRRDENPLGRERLAYPLQLGSGTVDLHTGASLLGRRGRVGWGIQVDALFRLGENDLGYSLGDRLDMTGWLEAHWTSWLRTSVRLAWSDWDDISGRDAFLDPQRTPLADAGRQGGSRLELGPGLVFSPPGFGGQSFSVEVLWPVHRSLDGPRLETDLRLSAGWEWAF